MEALVFLRETSDFILQLLILEALALSDIVLGIPFGFLELNHGIESVDFGREHFLLRFEFLDADLVGVRVFL